MIFQHRLGNLASLLNRVKGMFNLNDPRWGRGDEGKSDDSNGPPNPERPNGSSGSNDGSRNRNPQPGGQPPDLDELWRDLNRKLSGIFGAGGGNGGGSSGGGFQPDMKSAGVGVSLILGVVFIVWLGTGIFIVREGEQGVVTQFGKYKTTVGAGFNWRLPYPIERHELVLVTQIRSTDVGRDSVIKSTGLRESAMLTEDENIVEIKFAVQYRLNDARAWLFESSDPDRAVVQAAESAVREVVGRMKMDSALAEERDQIAPRVRTLMQTILDRYKVGVEVVGINLQQGGVRPPEQVQSAFDDVLKAGQERERAKNDAEAYANDVIPRAVGSASRLKEEADAYKAKIVAQAQGDAQRFASLLSEYQKAPAVTRDRLYLDAMQQVYSSVTKVLVESRQGSNLLYMPLDKLLQGGAISGGGVVPDVGASTTVPSAVPSAPPAIDPRTRDVNRSRDRESR
jgi:membrane protease subunit HflK